MIACIEAFKGEGYLL